MPQTQRRRLLAGLVLVGLAPMEALAQAHSNSRPSSGGSSATRPATTAGATAPAPAVSAPPLPECVLDKVAVSSGITVSSKVESGNVVQGFVLYLTLPATALRLTGLQKSTASSNVSLEVTCQLLDGQADGFDIREVKLYLPEVRRADAPTPVAFGQTTLKIGSASLVRPGDNGVYGTNLNYTALYLTAEQFGGLTAALKRGGNLTLAAPAASGAGSASLTYAFPRLTTVFATVKPKLDKLRSDAVAGLCRIPAASEYMAKFCTTATIEVIGLDRRCWELKALHRFRDWMRQAPAHALEADLYADRAPEIVRAIARRGDARRIWLAAYFTGVLPAAAAARLNFNPLARLIYRALCLRLVRLAALSPA